MKKCRFSDIRSSYKLAATAIVLAMIACNLNQVVNPYPNLPTAPPSKIAAVTESLSNENSPGNSPSDHNPTPPPRTVIYPTDESPVQTPIELLATATPVENIETLLSTCPSDLELDRFNTDFHILFDSADPFPPYECQDGTGPGGQVNPKLALYQGLRAIHALQFSQALPWTEHGLYEWLREAIHGIVVTDTEYSHCCAAGKKIVLKADLLYQLDYQVWGNPQSGGGLMGLIGLIVHEARHAEIGGHTCGSDDCTLEELGAWGVQYYLYLYMAENTPAAFFTQQQRQMTLNHADTALTRISNP
jgi:hypothetical protein